MDVWKMLAWATVAATGAIVFLTITANAVGNTQRRIDSLIAAQKARLERQKQAEQAAKAEQAAQEAAKIMMAAND